MTPISQISIRVFQKKIKGCDDSYFFDSGDVAEVKNHLTGKKALIIATGEIRIWSFEHNCYVSYTNEYQSDKDLREAQEKAQKQGIADFFDNNNWFEVIVADRGQEYEFGFLENYVCYSYDEAIKKAIEFTKPDIYSIRGLAFKIRDHFQRFIKANTPESEQYNSRWAGEFEIMDRAKCSYPYRFWLIHYGKPILQIKIVNLDSNDLRPQLVKEGLINSRSDQRGINSCLVAFGFEKIIYSKERGRLVKV